MQCNTYIHFIYIHLQFIDHSKYALSYAINHSKHKSCISQISYHFNLPLNEFNLCCIQDISQNLYIQFTILKHGNQQHFFKRGSGSSHFHKPKLCTYIYTTIQVSSIFLQKLVNITLILEVRRILICPSIRRAYT